MSGPEANGARGKEVRTDHGWHDGTGGGRPPVLFAALALALSTRMAAAAEVVDLFASGREEAPATAVSGPPRPDPGSGRPASASRKDGPVEAEEDRKVYRIALGEAAEDGGRYGGVEGRAGAEGDRFGIEGLGLFEPVDLLLLHDGTEGKLYLEIFKYRFDQPLERAEATPEEPAVIGLRTQGGIRIRVRAEQAPPVPYRLFVRVAPEETDRIAPPFIADAPEAATGSPAAEPGDGK